MNTGINVDEKIRLSLQKFDDIVYPFLDGDKKLGKMKKYDDNISMNISILEKEQENAEQDIVVKMLDKNSGSEIRYMKTSEKYVYVVNQIIRGNISFLVMHSYNDNKNEEPFEIIGVSYYGKGMTENLSLTYDLKNGLIVGDNKWKDDITEGEKEYIYKELINAINYANTILVLKNKEEKLARTI